MKRIFTFGVFDFFHLGHLRVFKQCKRFADFLIVAVQEDDYVKVFKPGATLLYSLEERVEIINSILLVDEVIKYKEMTPAFLESIEFDILALGEDQVNERFDLLVKWCLKNKKEVIRLKRTPGISSSDIKTMLKTSK